LAPFVYLAIICNYNPKAAPHIIITKEKLINGEINTFDSYCFIACFDLCINASCFIIDPKRKSNRWEEVVSIEIYIGFVHVDIGFYYFAYIGKSIHKVKFVYSIGCLLIHWEIISNPAQYFIGIKTPWTLENKEVWKLIHILRETLVIGGLLIVLGS
jgi:hypothetical protein